MNPRYGDVCQESPVADFEGQELRISFASRDAENIDNSSFGFHQRTTITIQISCDARPSDDVINTFAINNCRELVNRVVIAYQATTGEVDNGGFITPVGTSYMRLFAEIYLDGDDVRDRWPFRSGTNISLSGDEVERFREYVTGGNSLPIGNLMLTNASIQAEQGQYSLAVFLAAAAVESRLTAYVVEKMEGDQIHQREITKYKNKPLGYKLGRIAGEADSIETYLGGDEAYASLHAKLKGRLNKELRIPVVHNGHLASRDEAREANDLAYQFFRATL